MAARRRRSKTALVLASGGVTGVSYEVGALRALDHILANRSVNDFDIYVGTSAGAVVAACMASGLPPVLLASVIAGTIPSWPRMNRSRLFRPNFGEIASRLLGAPALIAEAVGEYWRYRDRIPLTEAIWSLSPIIPSGIFTNSGLEDYMRESFARMGISDDFRDLPRELHIVAADIETDKRVSFSKFSHADVPVSRAVAASTCIPILFRPTDIEGRHYVDGGIKGHAAIDLAIQRGAKLIIVINGLVPLDTAGIRERTTYAGVRRSIYELGVRAIYNQVVRGMLHDTLTEHINAVRERNPDVDIILIEPRPDDAKMFFHEVMSFSAQLIVLQHGYESVINGLYRSWSLLAKIFPEHGIEITRQVVERKPLQVPVEEASSKALLSRLRQTVLDQRTPTSLPPKRAAAAARRRKRAPAPGRTQTRRSGDRANFKPRVISGGAKS